MEANLVNQIESKEQKLKIAHNAMKQVTSRKPKICLEDYDDKDDSFELTYYYEGVPGLSVATVSKELVFKFIERHYKSTYDGQAWGCHVQYEDTRSADQYLEENTTEVLNDFLNNGGLTNAN